MDWNDCRFPGKAQETIVPREEKIRETIQRAKDAYFLQEQEVQATYGEFLWSQLRYTRKRWWLLQAAFLAFAMQLIPWMEDYFARLRTTGVVGCLFVVLMIPELWRNKETNSVQIEAACLYSLRQIYACRITLFGVVDVALLTLFGLGLGCYGFSLTEVVSHLLLPATVTACICFFLLCGKTNFPETVSLAACLVFGAAWWLVLMCEKIYTMIVPSVWMALFGVALIFLAVAIRKTVRETNQYWEVAFV